MMPQSFLWPSMVPRGSRIELSPHQAFNLFEPLLPLLFSLPTPPISRCSLRPVGSPSSRSPSTAPLRPPLPSTRRGAVSLPGGGVSSSGEPPAPRGPPLPEGAALTKRKRLARRPPESAMLTPANSGYRLPAVPRSNNL